MFKYRIPRTTVGRFWGYVGIAIALSVSLAGNVTAAYLESADPSWVDLGFAGIPPLVAFLSIEIVNHNPWSGTPWGPYVSKVMLAVVAPASAVVSFIHLVSVVMHGRTSDGSPEGVLNWVTAVLTALLIDGLMFGGTAALLLPKKVQVVEEESFPQPLDLTQIGMSLQDDINALAAASRTPPYLLGREAQAAPGSPPKPKVSATLAQQRRKPDGPRKRFAPTEHPLWERWLAARTAGQPWSKDTMAIELKGIGKDVTLAAAGTQISRWERHLQSGTS